MKIKPWIVLGEEVVAGEALIRHHRKWQTSSYHCVKCGGSNHPLKMYPCRWCGATEEEIKKCE
jgi:hypothetical protein